MALTDAQKVERTKYIDENIKITRVTDEKGFIFVSYASDDWETVYKKIISKLQQQYKLRIYCDRDFETNNSKWFDIMQQQMKHYCCQGVLAFYSEAYLTSYAALMELITAETDDTKGYVEEAHQIFPVFLDDGKSFDTYNRRRSLLKRKSQVCNIKKEEWEYFEKLIKDDTYERTGIDLKELRTKVKKEEPLAIKNIVQTFLDNEDKFSGSNKYYNPDAIDILIKNIADTFKRLKLDVFEKESDSDDDEISSDKTKEDRMVQSVHDNTTKESEEISSVKEKESEKKSPSEESSDDFAEGDNLFDDIDLSDFETDEKDSLWGAEFFDDPFSAKSLDNGNKDILNDNLPEKDKKWGILTLHNELDFPRGVIRFQYSTDEFGFGREIVGLQINTDIIPCRYEGSGTYYEPEYLIFDSLFESLRISCPPNDRVVFYVDPDRFILTEDHAELTLILGTEPAKTKVNDILKEIKGHSKLRIEIDRLNKRAVVSELRANDVIEGSVEIDISSDTLDISGKKQDDGNDSFGFDFGQDDEYELLDFGFNLAELNEDTTLSEFEKICENVNFCMELRKVRKDKTVTAQLFDYFMASLLGGCDSPAMKKEDILRKAVYNYCKYAVAKDCDPNTVGFGASQWTWSSNARKAVRPEDRPADYYDANGNFKGSGKLGANSDIFEKLPRNLTIGDVLKKYENREVGFNTKDNEMIFRSWALIKELNNG